MSRYSTSSQKQSKNPSKSGFDTPLTMVSARSKLKEVEDKIYEARHRIEMLNKRRSRVEYKSLHKTRMDGFKNYIRDFAQNKNEMKREHQLQKSMQVQNFHQTNMERRAEHKEKLSEMKEMLQTQNQWVYENIRKQKQANQNAIRRQRSREYEQKRRKRDVMYDDQQKRLVYFKQFLKNRHLTAKLAKDEQSSSIQDKILQREKLLEKLQRQTSQMSMNPEQMSKSNSGEDQGKSPSKGFRINSRKSNKVNAEC